MSRRTNGTASAFTRRQREPMVEVTLDVLDIGRRIQDGDELWRGDPSMALTWNQYTEEFEVIALDGKGQPYVVLSAPECDQRILIQLAESDWQRAPRERLARMVAQEAANAKAKEAAMVDMESDIAQRLAWGLKQVFAAHMGGRTDTYSFNTGGRR